MVVAFIVAWSNSMSLKMNTVLTMSFGGRRVATAFCMSHIGVSCRSLWPEQRHRAGLQWRRGQHKTYSTACGQAPWKVREDHCNTERWKAAPG